ncbi:general substrate transporter [Saitoella complicata NRRL Y-17804]|uniref:Major facilitator superfamily (MFS) profile domain-containing protein n=1 Tax=Saitoella complicata (strain BCRC 22490 / CBS 7301 / JCM 7358 / NBRC 10748 / NRRL Y-17804) TaxID=698492 RepID=A0A0E9NEM6_SAICN|nr:general substrate transporter [Saitoella complicata NRRL Y-17804]ODQ50812.1 general substrate transporter [Saitoella complicata NRRL Y-17804]GAO48299.1 hypothetical protein G7K_2477-t1 [Saitoella complicata NRRL Y-17804]
MAPAGEATSSMRIWGNARGDALRMMISIAASSAFLLFGYDQGVFAGLIGGNAFKETFPASTKTLGTIVAIYEVGCFFGAVLTFFVGEKLGRRWSIVVGLIIMLVGTVLQATAYGIPHMIVGRIVTGIGNGMNTSTVPMYQAETSKAHSRGRMVSIEGWFITVGIVISYWVTYGTAGVPDGAIQFRLPIVLQALFAIITLILIFGLPESPRWLMNCGREVEAREVIALLEGVPIESEECERQFNDIKVSLSAESQGGPIQFKEYFRGGEQQTFRRLLLAYGIQMMQQLTGINAVIFYSAYLLQNTLGLDRELSLIVGGCTGLCFFVFTFIPIIFIDKWGRRKPLIYGAAFQAVCMCMIGVLIGVGGKSAGTAAIIFVFLYIASYSGFGWVACPWLYPTEIVELRFRSKGTALATMSNWSWNFMVVEITPIGAETLGYKFFFIFMVFNACFVPLIYFFYPETAGKSLEELDLLFVTDREGAFAGRFGNQQGSGRSSDDFDMKNMGVERIEAGEKSSSVV